MPTPHAPATFKPVAAGYSIGAPDGVVMSEVAGGMPRVSLDWSRGKQVIQLGRIMKQDEFQMWTLWYQRVINNGAIQFFLPLDSGLGLQDHLCMMAPGSYSAVPLAGNQVWSVTFSVIVESSAYALSDEDVTALLGLWDATGEGLGALIARIGTFATQDTLVLQP